MTLETKYRRLSRLFPPAWRAEHEDALIGTLLDTAEPGRDSVPLAETVDLVRGALLVRTRGLHDRLTMTAPIRRVGMAAVAVLSAFGFGLIARFAADEVSAEFLLTSLVVVLIPGTGVVYTISSAISGGWRRGTFAAIGCTLGIVPHILAALVGLSGVMQAGAAVFEAVRWAGVVYLVLMGISMIREGGGLQFDTGDAGGTTGPAGPMGPVVRRAVLLNLLNPKLTVFFFAFLPQFLDEAPGLGDPRLVGLSAVFMLETMVVFLLYAGVSAALRERVLRTPAVLRWVRRALGSLVIGFAAHLALGDR